MKYINVNMHYIFPLKSSKLFKYFLNYISYNNYYLNFTYNMIYVLLNANKILKYIIILTLIITICTNLYKI